MQIGEWDVLIGRHGVRVCTKMADNFCGNSSVSAAEFDEA